jgi:hypothetical protein
MARRRHHRSASVVQPSNAVVPSPAAAPVAPVSRRERKRIERSERKAASEAARTVPHRTRREKWLGTPEREIKVPRHTPEGMEALQMLLQQGTQGLQNPLAGFGPIKDDILRTYKEELLPTIAERFANMGSHGGAVNSSGFEGEKNMLAERLSKQLAAQEAEYGLTNRQGLLDMLQLGLTPQFDNKVLAAQPGNLEKFLLPAASGTLDFLKLIPGFGPLLAGLGKAGIGTAKNILASRRGADLPYDMEGFISDFANKDTMNSLQDWLQDRRARSKTVQYTPLSSRPTTPGMMAKPSRFTPLSARSSIVGGY